MSTVLTYTPSDVTLTISGWTITGLVSANVTWEKETFKIIHGIRGRNTRVQNLDTSAILTIEFLQTSISNDILTDLFIADKATQSSRLEVSLKDNSGLTEISSSEAYVSNLPQTSFSEELTTRTWTIHLLNSTAYVKGNAKPLPDIFGGLGDFASDMAGKLSSIDSSRFS